MTNCNLFPFDFRLLDEPTAPRSRVPEAAQRITFFNELDKDKKTKKGTITSPVYIYQFMRTKRCVPSSNAVFNGCRQLMKDGLTIADSYCILHRKY